MNTNSYQKILEMVAVESLNDAGTYMEFNEKDLEHATLIFLHVFMPLFYDHHKKLGIEKCEILADEFGKNIRQTVKLATGYDLAKVVKK